MWPSDHGDVVRVLAPAKVNLFLEALARRPDGYHELATLMVTVGLFDTVEVRDAPPQDAGVRLTCDHPGLSTGPDNLVVKAAELMRRRYGLERGFDLRLVKRIPLAAGLAGGSSDAAATLAGINRLRRLGLGRAELSALGAELGSDVSFFFHGPAAWCTGRGEVVEPMRPGCPLDLVLACPAEGLSTAKVFGNLTVPERPRDGTEVRSAVEAGDLARLGASLFNRLQEVAERLCPPVAEWYGRLKQLGPVGALMSGSGTTCFALARTPEESARWARTLADVREDGAGGRVHVVRSCC